MHQVKDESAHCSNCVQESTGKLYLLHGHHISQPLTSSAVTLLLYTSYEVWRKLPSAHQRRPLHLCCSGCCIERAVDRDTCSTDNVECPLLHKKERRLHHRRSAVKQFHLHRRTSALDERLALFHVVICLQSLRCLAVFTHSYRNNGLPSTRPCATL